MLDHMDEMQDEYDAWQRVVSEFIELGMNVDDPHYDSLIKAITLWGEELSMLRARQGHDTRRRALKEHQEDYAAAIKKKERNARG